AELLPRVVASPVQISILEGLAQRNDPTVGPAIASLARKSDMPVRVAALRSLGALGNDSAVPLLAEAAASGTPEEQAAGRQALVEIHLGKVTDALLKEMADGRAAQIQAEAARALGQRGDADAFPKLLEIARGDNASCRTAALPALALLATEQHIGDLIQLVADARAETVRSQAVEALNTALQRLQSSHRVMDLTFLVKVIESGPADIRIALLGVCSGLSEPQLRPGLRHAVADSNPAVRAAAIRALCDTHDL